MMKTKVSGNQTIKRLFILFVVFLLAMTILNRYQYRTYTRSFNEKIDQIIAYVIEEYPDTSRNDIIDILYNDLDNVNILRDFGIDIEKDSLVEINDNYHSQFVVINWVVIIIFMGLVLLILFYHLISNKKEIRKITKTIEQINQHNYDLQVDDNSEDELSILNNEITKTTVMLREMADVSLKDKLSLKTSIADISHQLRTPLASMTVMLESLADNSDMEVSERQSLIRKTKQELLNINQLVEALLTLSKLDTNTLTFNITNVNVLELIQDALNRVEILAELHNVSFEVNGASDLDILCDKKWQTEAIANVVKNSIEHSTTDSIIKISFSQNKFYTKIEIQDSGFGIDPSDLPHIFKRFYKGKNDSKNSIGIGLALSKSIIEENSGSIAVDSKLNMGTLFTIKYYV